LFSSSLTVAGGEIPQWKEHYFGTGGTAMRVKTNNDKRVGRSSIQQSAENCNHTEEIQHGPATILPDIGIISDRKQH